MVSHTADGATDPEARTGHRPEWSFETRQIHAGSAPDPTTGARIVPIFQTGSYVFDDVDHAARVFGLEQPGYIYSRVQNPTSEALEKRLADLEGALEAVVFASGQAAITTSLLNVCGTGSHVVASAALHGGSYNLLRYTLPSYGIETTFVDDPDDMDAWRAAIRPTTRIVFGETVGNPRSNLLDIPAIADIAHTAGVPLMIDNTALTPYLLRPLEHGADLVVHSTSKYLSGHGTLIGGVLLDGGSFDFGAAPERFPEFNDPDASFHGLRYWPTYGPGAFAKRLRTRLMRDMGPTAAPMNSFLVLQGVETLSLRMARHADSALQLAAWLESRPEVSAVHYPGLPSSPWHGLSRRLAPRGAGGVVAFDLAGGMEAGARFVDALELISHLANLGDVRTLVVHPASTTHYQLTDEQKLAAGVTPGLIRLSVGLEAVEDLKADLAAGLRAAGTGTAEEPQAVPVGRAV
ncbi:O-acetylhomoserine aminocarboxypropyltransferase/cysteine synthase family protein [Streptomyces coerulescens]|uniref:O-acetylhomoserine aminocarboxypropyltransferase/cysteine synthase family protein n=1 Tax=Streptomyces coerulescens TaxID=29304 RepID=A0ABW0CJH8_STRCD